MNRWSEVANGVFHRRYDPLDVSVCVVRGSRGMVLVDTRSNHREADQIRSDLEVFGNTPLLWVVNTHAHYDHCFGNHRFGPDSAAPAPIVGHRRVPQHLETYERPMLEQWCRSSTEAHLWREVVLTPPSELVDRSRVLDLGDRAVTLMHLGRGHTDNDLLLHDPAAGVWLVGDLLEESGPPMYGSGCFPLDWPETLGALDPMLGVTDVLIPGHGAPVDPAFARSQRAELATAAGLIRRLHADGIPLRDAQRDAQARWPFPAGTLEAALTEGYRQLDLDQR